MTDADSPRADIRYLIMINDDVGATHGHLDAIVADVLNAAAADGASLGVLKEQGAGHFDGGLKRGGIVGRRLPFGMGKGETFESEVVDRGAGAAHNAQHLG